ncbi:MAG: alpha/beta hydrolase [Flavobacteriales bacterium]|nr:alpha/beta hydrolase [Flavobacteriales bacterium]
MKKYLCFVGAFMLTVALYAQKTEDVSVTTEKGATLYGTLTMPEVVDMAPPLVIMIAGSGPTDRNGNNPQMKNNSLLFLSDALVKNGISTLRYDKLGIGQSVVKDLKEEELSFEDYVQGAESWVKKYSADTRFSKIIIMGHSEGSLIGMLVAQRQKSVGGFISLAGTGRDMAEILREQLAKQAPQAMTVINPILDSLKKGKTVPDVMPQLNAIFRPSVQPFLISQIKYDPAVEIKKLTVPVLIISGDKDLQVSKIDFDALCAAKTDAKNIVIANMSHVLKETDTTDMQTQFFKVYMNPDLPVVPLLVRVIINFSK